MKNEKKASVVVAFVMALTAFGIPSGAFAAEANQSEALADPPAVSVQEFEAEEPAAAEAIEEEATEEETIEEEPIAEEEDTIPSVDLFSVSEDTAKYEAYLNYNRGIAAWADYDDCEVYGEFPDVEIYNEDLLAGGRDASFQITDREARDIGITVKIGDKTYTGKVDTSMHGTYEFAVKFNKVALGTPVTVTYNMGSCTRTEKMIVSRWVHPKYTVKNYTYDGKYHKGAMIIKIGSQTLKQGKDYYISSEPIRDVGMSWVGAYSIEGNKYRFGTDEDAFRINPKGTSIKKLKKDKKAFTVRWNMQAMKMSKSRITGYQIQYSTNKKFTKKTTKMVTVKGYKNTSQKIKKLKKKTKYYVRVRTYKNLKYGNGTEMFLSSWSKIKSVKTK